MPLLSHRAFTALTKQYYFGIWIGAAKSLFTSVMFYYTPINFLMMAITVYTVSGAKFITQYLPWFTVWDFLGFLVAVMLVLMVLEYKFIRSSDVAFANIQGNKHQNVALEIMLKRFDKQDQSTQNVIDRLDEIEKRLSKDKRA